MSLPHASFFFLPPHFLSSFSCCHGPLLYCRCVVGWGQGGGGLGCGGCEGLLGSRRGGRRSGGYVVGYVAAPARWRYAPPPRHTVVSAAVAACSVAGEGVGLMTYMYSCHAPLPPKKRKKKEYLSLAFYKINSKC